ncbi:MAG: Uncharacterised protein [Halieaceae bacterium]|nr:MAG: Uncharacterised protein [Halieaceae bacterium]
MLARGGYPGLNAFNVDRVGRFALQSQNDRFWRAVAGTGGPK